MREDSLREALRRAASGEPPAGDAYARFLARRQRGVRLRGFVVVVAGSAAVATLFLVLPGPFNQGPPTNFAGGGPNSPSGYVRHYVDPKARFQLDYPADWLARGVAGDHAEFYPPKGKQDTATAVLYDTEYCRECGGSVIDPQSSTNELAGTAIEHPHRFYVRIIEVGPASCPAPAPGKPIIPCEGALSMALVTRADAQAEQRAGARIAEAPDRVAGNEAVRFDSTFPERPPRIGAHDPAQPDRNIGPDFWCAGCTMTEYFFSNKDWRFAIRIVAPDSLSWNTYSAEATRLVESFSSLSPSAQPTVYP